MTLELGSFASVTDLRREKEHLKGKERELLFSDDLEEWMLGQHLKQDFVLNSACVQSAPTDLLSLCVRAVCAQFRCTFHGEVSSLLPSSASTA